MAKPFLTDDFLLHSDSARILYFDYARHMPIFDYHCHLPVIEIDQNKRYDNLTQIWLYGDHYKWRAMRAQGVDERLITGDASDWEKFEAWAAVVPYTVRNPLYHWTHMELKNPFGIEMLLKPETAREIFDRAAAMLQTDDFRARRLMERFNVKVVCTTDDPTDGLDHHQAINNDPNFHIKVLPAFRPDKAMAVENPKTFNAWVDKLAAAADTDVKGFTSFLKALRRRHEVFHEVGCRVSDHGLDMPYAEDYTAKEIKAIFDKVRKGKRLSPAEIAKFKSAMLVEFAVMDAEKGWVQQFHLAALRNNNSRMFKALGPDTGFDSIGDFQIACGLSRFLDALDAQGKLAKTILYSLNPTHNEILAAMVGNFQDGSAPGKMQFGSAWWFNDTLDGMTKQMNALSNMGLLSRFVGMLTDSRSFLSYPRHDYFRRLLCNLIGDDVERGELPADMPHLGKVVQDICFNNAALYFGIET
ncbi:MAG: glucuronate isomerase [Planctomycetota bacterium]